MIDLFGSSNAQGKFTVDPVTGALVPTVVEQSSRGLVVGDGVGVLGHPHQRHDRMVTEVRTDSWKVDGDGDPERPEVVGGTDPREHEQLR